MNIDEFCKSVNFPKMKIFGKTNAFIYYVEKTSSKDITGLPVMIKENVKLNKFDVLDSDQILAVLDLFRK